MITSTKDTNSPAQDFSQSPGFSPDELRAAIKAGEELRSETIYQAFASAIRFVKQVPSRLHLTGTHRHA